MTNLKKAASILASAAALLLLAAPVFGNATITIVNGNTAGVGFNDPTPAAPIGGNTGTTIGEQRLIAFQHAASIWGATLDSNVEIRILSTFEPLACNATAAVLGSAGTIQIFADFTPNAPYPGPQFTNTWHHGALANKRSGFDLVPAPPNDSDLRARFNVNLGQPGCLTGIGWYLGLDNNHGTQIDLVVVLLHEFAHGLGFSQFASVTSGAQQLGLTDVYGRKLLDTSTGKFWNQMTNAERQASAINTRNLVWTGAEVTAAIPGVLNLGTPFMELNAPPGIAGTYLVGTASFGPALTAGGVTGDVVLADDGVGVTSDACEPLINGLAVTNNIALVDRGACNFDVKVLNAQNAGAMATIVADNVAGSPPPGIGGVGAGVTIPSVRITLADGNLIKANLPGVNATLAVDPSQRSGADTEGRALVNTPNPVQPGSSVSHWDTIAFPNQLMEPAINGDLTHSVKPPEDLSLPLMRDVGWFPDADVDGVSDGTDQCPESILGGNVVIDGCDSGVSNTTQATGCSVLDVVQQCADTSDNHGQFVKCVTKEANSLKKAGIITGVEKEAIVACAEQADIP